MAEMLGVHLHHRSTVAGKKENVEPGMVLREGKTPTKTGIKLRNCPNLPAKRRVASC